MRHVTENAFSAFDAIFRINRGVKVLKENMVCYLGKSSFFLECCVSTAVCDQPSGFKAFSI